MSEQTEKSPHLISVFAAPAPAAAQASAAAPAAAAAEPAPSPTQSATPHQGLKRVHQSTSPSTLVLSNKPLARSYDTEEQVARPRMQSLSLFTAKFLRILRDSRSDAIDLNNVAKELNITKRKITDVLNVLEGSELIERSDANTVVWIAPFPVTSIPLLKELAEEQTVGQIVPQRDMSNTRKLQVQLYNLTSAIEREKMRLNAAVAKAHVVLPKPTDFTVASKDATKRFYFVSADKKPFRVCSHPVFEDKNPETNEPRNIYQLGLECTETPLKIQVVSKDGTEGISNNELISQTRHEENMAKRWKPIKEPSVQDLFPATQTVQSL